MKIDVTGGTGLVGSNLLRVTLERYKSQGFATVYNEVVAATYREAETYLKDLQARLDHEQVSIEYRPASRGGARQILDFAADYDADLIVLSSHGRGLNVGSTATWLPSSSAIVHVLRSLSADCHTGNTMRSLG